MGFSLLKVRYWVQIENKLRKDAIDVHCMGDAGAHHEDLGLVEVPNSGNLNWTFKSRFWMQLQYRCTLTWPNHGSKEIIAFYDERKFIDKRCGGRHCFWKAADDGIYLYHIQKKKYIFAETWDKLSYNYK
ncbi:S-protein homolog 1-like [Chenopodium quinoa]|uniref:S-protein homolog 1-like n=1 Tax=Chenopodium quinoa TaxID=63459 RepID=UPI000B77CE90|nr:S-protein homolog 1-like [Chenopodium quinoa]